MDLQQQVLRTDVAGMPLEWIGYQEAVRLISLDQVCYCLGKTLYCIHGGINAISGKQSVVEVNAIIASHGHHSHAHLFSEAYTPPLSNKALFRRDQSLCLYCGEQFPNFMLSRDHRPVWYCWPFRSHPRTPNMSTCKAVAFWLTKWSSCWRTFPVKVCCANELSREGTC